MWLNLFLHNPFLESREAKGFRDLQRNPGFLIDMNTHIFFIINMIYHITDRVSWEAALKVGFYSTESVSKEGFIHCSFFAQVKYTKENYFKGKDGLMVLCIDETRLKSELRTEKGSSSADTELYPHLYGTLNTDAVSDIIELEKWKE